jgi:tRNA(Ile)-lysidine synthase
VLAVAIVCAAGREQTPRGPAVDRLLRRLEAGDAFTAVLAGARVEADGERVWIFRESGEAARGGLRPVRAEPGRPVVWDGRFEITANQPCEIRAAKGLISQLDAENQAALKAWPAAARAGLPVAVRDDNPKPLLAIRATRARDLTKLRHFAACGLIAHEKEITGLRVALTR